MRASTTSAWSPARTWKRPSAAAQATGPAAPTRQGASPCPDATPLLLEHAPDLIAYPHVRAVAPHLRVQNLQAVFEFGMETLFDALAAELGGAPAAAAVRRRR